MNPSELRAQLQWLRGEDGVAKADDVHRALGDLLLPLLEAEGLTLLEHKNPAERQIDFAAKRGADQNTSLSVAIEYKHFGGGRKIDVQTVRQLLGTLDSGPFERALLIGRFGFTNGAREAAARAGIAIELLDLADLSTWIDRVEQSADAGSNRVEILVRAVSHKFAELVAEDPRQLDYLEWRDLERMMARIMEGLGFQTTLTPPSKDGGKDLILSCTVRNKEESYVVELKHWRAGKPVIKSAVTDFLKVIAREERTGGMFLSTSGYAGNVTEGLTELTRQKLRLGDRSKVILLAQTYLRANSGLWTPPDELPEVLFEGALGERPLRTAQRP